MMQKTPLIKKRIIIGIVCALLLFLGSSTSHALFPHNEGTCDPNFAQLQQDLARVGLLRDNAIAKQIIEKPPSTVLMACMGDALMNAGRLGKIYSDNPNSIIAGTTSVIAGTLLGRGSLEGLLLRTMGLILLKWGDNFTDGVLAALQVAAFNVVQSWIASSVSAPVAALLSFLMTFACSGFADTWAQVVGNVGITAGAITLTLDDTLNFRVNGAGKALEDSLGLEAGFLGSVSDDLNTIHARSGLRGGPRRRNLCGSNTCKPNRTDIRLLFCGGSTCP